MAKRGDWASQLTERVVLQSPVGADDGQGGRAISWQDSATIWAKVEPLGNGTRAGANSGQREASAAYRITIRTREGVDATMRLLWRSRLLVLHSIHERDRMLVLLAYEENL